MKHYLPLLGPFAVMVFSLATVGFKLQTFALQCAVIVAMVPLLRWSGRKQDERRREIERAIAFQRDAMKNARRIIEGSGR